MAQEMVEKTCEEMVRKWKKCGTPSTAADWRVVWSNLIIVTDEALEELARQGRMQGVSWIVPVCEGILEELKAGRAWRDHEGAVRLKAKPQASGLQFMLN